MFPKTLQQAWIGGLPGLIEKSGTPFETLPFSMPKAGLHSLSFTIFGAKELVSNLQSLAKAGTKIKTLSIVVRTNAEQQLDDQYMLTGAIISSVMPIKEIPEAQTVTTIFESISARMGVSLNPGPPVNSPPVQRTGANVGWIFESSEDKYERGRPMEIVDFTPPHFNRRLTVTFGNPSSEIQYLIRNPTPAGELILVLPDRSSQRYVEFKLWDAKVSLLEDERHAIFESDVIECLTGQ